MNANVVRRLRTAALPDRAPSSVESVRKVPVTLTPIPWGKPDRKLGRAVCRHIAEFTPPTVIPYNPLTEQRVRRVLRSMHIVHD